MIVFDDMAADMLSNKKINLVVIKLFIRGRKLNIFRVSHVLSSCSYLYLILSIPSEKIINKTS